MYTDVSCITLDGVHHAGPYCPHEETEDETGMLYPPNWTAQQEKE